LQCPLETFQRDSYPILQKKRHLEMQSFSELPISTYTKNCLASAGFSVPTAVQAVAVPQALAGKDVLATAQTGTGKTIAFLIPVIEQLLREKNSGIAALVLVPTRELAMQVADQYDDLRGKELAPAALVVGGLSEGKQLDSLRRGARLVVATPGRLEDFLDRRLVSFRALRMLILDEADRMLDMGFLPAIRRIASILPRDRRTLCFSATLEASVAHLVHDYMRQPVRVELGSVLKTADNVRLRAFEVSSDRKLDVVCRLLAEDAGRCLVFARTKRGAERLAMNLNREGFAAAMIHGDRSQSQRTAALAGFQEGRYRILVATDLAARGIHVDDVSQVINYDLPEVAENFIHRVGRSGRAGAQGLASTLFGMDQRLELIALERTLGVKMERAEAGDLPERTGRRAHTQRANVSGPSRIGRLPGEFLQAQRA